MNEQILPQAYEEPMMIEAGEFNEDTLGPNGIDWPDAEATFGWG
jgi:hypothetical protein